MGELFRVQFRCGLERGARSQAVELEEALREQLLAAAEVVEARITPERAASEFAFVLLIHAADSSAALRIAVAKVSRIAREVCAADPWTDGLVQSVLPVQPSRLAATA